MRAKFETIKKQKEDGSILCYEVVVPSFEFYWHYHPEFELTYILKGKGRRMVGDSIENFAEGDLVLLGPSLPHTWVSDKLKKENCRAIVIQFSAGFTEPFLSLPEMKAIKKLLDKASNGIRFIKSNRLSYSEAVNKIYSENGVLLITSFLNFLEVLANQQMKTLASANFQKLNGLLHEGRINKVFHYIQNHFKGEVDLQTASELIHLSQSAFCKFFKRSVGKTFSDYVNEIRIAHACNLLIETDKSISTVANECGFDNLAYFNRIFLKKKKLQPGRYRKM